jgi:hypothetical protein
MRNFWLEDTDKHSRAKISLIFTAQRGKDRTNKVWGLMSDGRSLMWDLALYTSAPHFAHAWRVCRGTRENSIHEVQIRVPRANSLILVCCSEHRVLTAPGTLWKKNHPVNIGLVVHACRAAGGGGSKKGGKSRATGEQRSAAYHRNATEKSNRMMATPEFRDLDVDADFTNSGRESKYTVHKWNASFEVDLCCSQCKNVFECDETFVQEVHRKKQRQDVTRWEAYCDSWTTTSWCLSICLLCPLHTGWP